MTFRAVADNPAADGPAADEVVEVTNRAGRGGFLIVCEHASNAIPAEYAGLGLDAAAQQSHIAWDPGALAVARGLSERLDAPLVAQRFSRLLYDCNRPPESESAVPAVSEVYAIPGNADLSAAARQARVARFYEPFRRTLSACIAAQADAGQAPVLVTVHSFTPAYLGARREVEIGVLHDADSRLADALLRIMAARPGTDIRRNEPYGPADGVTHTLIEHGLPRGLLNVMLEIRNDLLADAAAQAAMAGWLADCLTQAVAVLGDGAKGREVV